MKLTKHAKIATFIMATLILSSCKASEPQETTTQTQAKTEQQANADSKTSNTSKNSTESEPTEIEWYAWLDEESNFTKLTQAYTELNPNVTFKLNFTPNNDYEQKLVTAFSGGAIIDGFAIQSATSFAVYQTKGQLHELDSFITEKKADLSGYEATVESIKMDGGIYALPYRTSAWVIYYNKDIFDAANEPYPDGDWTWEEYAEVAARLTSGSGVDKVYGNLNFAPTSMWWRIPANSKRSNSPLEPEMLDDWMQAAEFWLNLSQEGYQPPYADRAGEAGGDYIGAFLQNKYGMLVSGDWAIEMLNTKAAEGEVINYDIAPLPHWEGFPAETTGAAALLMVADKARNPEAVFDFIYWASSVEGSKILIDNDYFPAWQSDENITAFTEGKEIPEHIAYIVNQTINSQVPTDARYNTAVNIVKEEIELYLLEQQDLEAAKANIIQRMEDEVQ